MENVKYIPGDLVIYQGQICKVKGSILHYTKLLYNVKDNMVDAESLQGLPLTPRILETNGWKTQNGWYYFLDVVKGCIVNIGIDFKYKADDDKLYVELNGNNIIRIEYCHQLQHLLFGLGLDNNLKI